jgi:hypothetical protein
MRGTLIERWMRQPHFTCPRCDAKSWNPNDIRELYCGRCHLFFAPPDMREGAREAYRRSPPRPADEPTRASSASRSDDDPTPLTFPTPSYDPPAYDPPAAPDFDPGGGSSGGGGASGDW